MSQRRATDRVSFLYTPLNAELGRNLLQEFSLHRLIAPPVLLALIFYISARFDVAGQASNHSYLLTQISSWVLAGALLLWGTRRAAAGVLEEVDERSWDFQRLSQLSPVQLTTGKLFGSTAYGWYIALWTLGLQVAIGQSLSAPEWGKLTAWLMAGFTGQAAALLLALVAVPERRHSRKGVGAGLCQCGGLLFGLTVYTAYQPLDLDIAFYAIEMPYLGFYWMTCSLFLFWLLAGCVRLMRHELQYPSYPWVWTGFLIYLAVYLYGIEPQAAEQLVPHAPSGMLAPKDPSPAGLGTLSDMKPYFLLGLWTVLAFCAVLAESKDPKVFRELQYFLQRRRYLSALQVLPGWLIALLFSLVLAVGIALFGPVPDTASWFNGSTVDVPMLALAFTLFILRDIGVIWWFYLSPKRGRAMLGAFIYLFVLYSIIPWVLEMLHAPEVLMAFFLPLQFCDIELWATKGCSLTVYIWPITLECLLLLGLLVRRYRQLFAR